MEISIDSWFRVDEAARTILASNRNAYNRSYSVGVRVRAHARRWWEWSVIGDDVQAHACRWQASLLLQPAVHPTREPR